MKINAFWLSTNLKLLQHITVTSTLNSSPCNLMEKLKDMSIYDSSHKSHARHKRLSVLINSLISNSVLKASSRGSGE